MNTHNSPLHRGWYKQTKPKSPAPTPPSYVNRRWVRVLKNPYQIFSRNPNE